MSLSVGAAGFGRLATIPGWSVPSAGVGPSLALRGHVGIVGIEVRGTLGAGIVVGYGNLTLVASYPALVGSLPMASLPLSLRADLDDGSEVLLSAGPFVAFVHNQSVDYGPLNTVETGLQPGIAWAGTVAGARYEVRADVPVAVSRNFIDVALLVTASLRLDVCCAPPADTR